MRMFYCRLRGEYLSPAARLPLGAAASSAVPLLLGLGGQVQAVLVRDESA